MAFKTKARVTAVLPPTAQTSGDRTWASQQIVVDYGEIQPVNLALEFDPDKMPAATVVCAGDLVEVEFFPVSNEGKNANAGKWFSRNVLRHVKILEAVARPTQTPAPAPAQAAAPQATQATIAAPALPEELDSLPF